MSVNSITDSSVLQRNNNNNSNSDTPRENLASQVKGIKSTINKLQIIHSITPPVFSTPKKQHKKNNIEHTNNWEQLISSQENINLFQNKIKNSGRSLVHFPPSARGDMNTYKYIGFLDDRTRPLTIFEHIKCKTLAEEPIRFNNNLPIIMDHVNSMGNKLQEGHDYIICDTPKMMRLKRRAENIKHYQYYDSIISVPSIRKAIHEQFRRDIDSNSKIKDYFENKSLPCTGIGYFTRQNRLIMVNINKRKPEPNWNPREHRHTTPEIAHMQNLVDCIYDAKKEANKRIKEDQFDICFTVSELTKTEQNLWQEYGSEKAANVLFFNDLVKEGFNRIEQREVLFALSDQYKSTIYLGHQSGINEDAPIMPRTNVYSLSEYLGQGQVGIFRIEKKPQLDIVKQGPLGTPMHASNMGNFYSLRNSEFLTTEGILASVQIKIELHTQKHQPLDKLWDNLVGQHSVEMGNVNSKIADEHIVEEFLEMMLNNVNRKLSHNEIKNNFRKAINIIVQRMKGDAPHLSEMAKKYIINVMKQEMSPHDSHDPLTRHEHKLEAQNSGIKPYELHLGEVRIGAHEEPDANYFAWLYPNESE